VLSVPKADVARKSERVRFRRALALLGMTLVLPGSAQLMRGSKTVGRAALRIDALLVVGAIVGYATLGRNGIVKLGFETWALALGRVSIVVLGLCWLALFVDAWRLGRPSTLFRTHRVVAGGLSLALMAGVATPLAYGARLMQIQQQVVDEILVQGPIGDLYNGRLNVLLLGGDGGLDRKGIRTDSITLASIDVATGKTVLFSLPRNMKHVQFPPGTPLAKRWPDGFPDFLFGVYTWGTDNPAEVGGGGDTGATAMMAAVAQTLGIPVHYYALVNLAGFRNVVDVLGGITLRVEKRLPIGGGTNLAGVPQPVLGYIEPGLQKLDGYKALWYARSRSSTTDYDRMARQKCVMGAILREVDPLTILKNYPQLVGSAKHVLVTDLTTGALQRLVDTASKTKKTKVTSVQFNPPLVDPENPDILAIRARVQKAIAKSVAVPTVTASATPGPSKAPVKLTAKQKKAAAKKAAAKAARAAAKKAQALATAKANGDAVALEDTCQYS
jgi:LCP family protein required for cell wall assembly